MSRTKIFTRVNSPSNDNCKWYSSGSIKPDDDSDSETYGFRRREKHIPCYTIFDETPTFQGIEVITLEDNSDDDVTLVLSTPEKVCDSVKNPNVPPTPPPNALLLSPLTVNCDSETQDSASFKQMPKLRPIPPLPPTPVAGMSSTELPKMPQLTPIRQSLSPVPVTFSSASVSSDHLDLSQSSVESSSFLNSTVLEAGTSPDTRNHLEKNTSNIFPERSFRPLSTQNECNQPSSLHSSQYDPSFTVIQQEPKLKSILKLPLGENVEKTLAWVVRIKEIMAEKNVDFFEADRLEEAERKNKRKNLTVTFAL